MRKYFFVFLYFLFSISAKSQQLPDKVSLNITNMLLENVLDTITAQTGYNFSYNSLILPVDNLFTFQATEESIDKVMEGILIGTMIEFDIEGDQIILTRKKERFSRKERFFSVSGIVSEKENDELIPGMNVYLNGTSIGTVTNENGYFKLTNVPFGNYRIVFSHISYKPKIYEFSKVTPGELNASTEVEMATATLRPVEVTTSKWRRREVLPDYIEKFNEEFLGTSRFSTECRILNADVITFYESDDGNELKASSKEPIVIQNDALGYVVFCELDYFISKDEEVKYVGRVRFSELDPINDKENRKWKRNRRSAYYGSVRHFLSTLTRNSFSRKGYSIYSISSVRDVSEGRTSPIHRDSIIVKTRHPGLWELKLPGMLYVTYAKELESMSYVIEMERSFLASNTNMNNALFLTRKPDIQKSILEIDEDATGPIYIDKNGNVTNPTGLIVNGYWSWERMSDLVPINFDPKN
ncbi:MAG: carboxypeptidase-like regulatory domain-containing protein [Cyclobacteriaceae bacterium]